MQRSKTTKMKSSLVGLMCLFLGACATSTSLYEFERDRLRTVEQELLVVSKNSEQGIYSARGYDAKLILGTDLLDRLLSDINGTRITVDSKAGPISFVFARVKTDFSIGVPALKTSLIAIDKASAIQVNMVIDTRLQLSNSEDGYLLNIVAASMLPVTPTRMLDLKRIDFDKRLAQIEVSEITSRLPRISLPLQRQISMSLMGTSGAIGLQTGSASMQGQLKAQPVSSMAEVRIDQFLVSQSGLHLLVKLEESK